MKNYPLAPMSPLIRTLTCALLVLPLLFLAGGRFQLNVLSITALFLVVLYAWVWFWLRPCRFVVHPYFLEVVWPLRRRQLPRSSIISTELVNRRDLHAKTGWCIRIGAGGLWGGFGCLWTRKRGLVQMYLSRSDGLVWIESVGERPWLISPREPEEFVRALSD